METPPDPADAPTGLPDEAEREPPPLGTPDPDRDAPDTGEEAMPGIASDEGEPPTSG